MDFGLSQEQQMVVETVRRFVENEIYPLEPEVERTGEVRSEVARDIQRKVMDMGFYAPNVPVAFGGGGLDTLTLMLLERELGRAALALGLWWGRPSNILCAGTEQQIERYLLPCVRGEKMDALAMTEPEAGSDIRSMKATARRDGDDFVLNGTKHFISHADVADFVIVFMATGEEETPQGPKKTLTAFLVDRGTPGFEITRGSQSVSHRGYHHCNLTFDDCRLPARQVLGEVDDGFNVMNTWLASTRLTVAAQNIGRARRAFELANDWAAERRQFGRPIGRNQGISFKLADMITEIEAAEWQMLATAWKLDQTGVVGREVAQAKLYASEVLARVTDQAVQIFGGMGLMEDLPIERLWRDARVERIWDGTSEIQRHIISRELLRPKGA